MTAKKVTRSASKINVKIGRFGEATTLVKVCAGSCVGNVLNDLSISYNNDTPIYINGSKAFDDQVLKNNDTVQVIGRKKGGNK